MSITYKYGDHAVVTMHDNYDVDLKATCPVCGHVTEIKGIHSATWRLWERFGNRDAFAGYPKSTFDTLNTGMCEACYKELYD